MEQKHWSWYGIKTPLYKRGENILRHRGSNVHLKDHSILCLILCLPSTVIAWLLNGFLSLFRTGNSVAKWLLLETSTRKLWMAAAALAIVMNAMVCVWCRCSICWRWPFVLIKRFECFIVAEIRFTRLIILSLYFASFCMLCWIDRIKELPLLFDFFGYAAHLISLTGPAKVSIPLKTVHFVPILN